MIHTFKNEQFVKFIIVGGIAAFVNFCSRIFLNLYFNFSISILIAYIFGMLTAFLLNKLFVFRKSNQVIYKSILYFVLVNIIAVIQIWAISKFLAEIFFPLVNISLYKYEAAHAIGIIIPIFTSYIGHLKFSFK